MGKKKCGGVYGVVPAAAVAFAGTGCWDESPRNLTEGYIGTGSRGTEGRKGRETGPDTDGRRDYGR